MQPKASSPYFASNVNPLSANPTKWSNTLKKFVGNSRQTQVLNILWGWRLKA